MLTPAVKPKKSQYIFNADLIRSFAIIAVVGIHLLSPIYARPDFFNGSLWWISFILNGLFRSSVPLFIILSGYLVLGKQTSVKANLIKTFNRIIIPLISFYLIYHAYLYAAATLRAEPYHLIDLFINLTKNTYSYLYFLVVLAYLYLLIPLFQPLFKSDDKKTVPYVILFFFANAILATFLRYITLREGDVFHTFTLWIVWIGYFLFGYWYRLNEAKFKTKTLTITFGISYLLTLALGYQNLYWHNSGNDQFYIGGQTYGEEYLSFSVVAMSVSLFILLMRMKLPRNLSNNQTFIKTIKWLAGVSFGLYLVHPIVMDFLHKFVGVTADSPTMTNLTVYLFTSSVLTIGISLILSMVILKIPGLRRIVGAR